MIQATILLYYNLEIKRKNSLCEKKTDQTETRKNMKIVKLTDRDFLKTPERQSYMETGLKLFIPVMTPFKWVTMSAMCND